jgi:predicted nucleic acid-binding protein
VIQVVILDTAPLGLVTNPVRTPEVKAINLWVDGLLAAGLRVVVPAIADYEVRRELERAGKIRGLGRLDAFNAADPDRYLPLSDAALRLGAKLWAQARNAGTPTGDPRELDCDVLIAAQALTLGVSSQHLVVATTNIGHFAQFLKADLWTNVNV